jgi:acyl-CoA synthetase (AMP-forming)/AMP-acid ligase II
MRTCIVTAEASPLDLIDDWQKCIPNATIYDFYGPTEATIYCTYYTVEKDKPNKSLNGMLSIGKPLKNVDAIIVDEKDMIVTEGHKGELCVAGDQITSGYWEDLEKNAEAFFEKEYKGMKRRFYHTGDLCYLEEDSNLMLYGRKDSQVKIQGYRVELGEIEYHARKYLKGINVVVIPFLNKSKNTELAVFIESKKSNSSLLMNYLKSKLPLYMVPTKIIYESNFQLNASDKVDKKKLKQKLK